MSLTAVMRWRTAIKAARLPVAPVFGHAADAGRRVRVRRAASAEAAGSPWCRPDLAPSSVTSHTLRQRVLVNCRRCGGRARSPPAAAGAVDNADARHRCSAPRAAATSSSQGWSTSSMRPSCRPAGRAAWRRGQYTDGACLRASRQPGASRVRAAGRRQRRRQPRERHPGLLTALPLPALPAAPRHRRLTGSTRAWTSRCAAGASRPRRPPRWASRWCTTASASRRRSTPRVRAAASRAPAG